MFYLNNLLLAAVCLSISIGGVTAQTTVLTVPGQTGQPTNVFSGEPFASRNSFTASNVAFQALSSSDGSKIYVIQRAGSDTVLVIDAVNPATILQRFSFGSNGEGAALTPNGQRLLVAAGTLHVINTANDTEVASIPVGSQPNDVAASLDGSRAFVLSQSSGTLTAVNLANNQVTGTPLSVPGGATSVEVGPNGLVYVTAINRVLEIDPRTMALRTEIPLNARPTQLQFTPDGKYAVALNETPVTGSSVLLFDLASKTLAGFIPNLTAGNIILDKLRVVGNNRAYATRQGGGALYQITLSPLNIDVASYSSIDALSNVQLAAASGELSSARYLFVATPGSLYRFSLASSILAPQGQLGLTTPPNALLTAMTASTGIPSTLLAYNTNQTLPSTGGAALPLVIRALDSTGNPVRGANVTFQTTDTGLSFSTVSSSTDVRGFAQSSVSLPNVAGAYTVTASVAGGQSTTFTLTVGSGAGDSGGVSIVSGNGQIVLEQFLVQDPMVVVVRDTNGAPVAGATVTFQLTSGAGTLGTSTFGGIPATATCSANVCTATTDAQGQASVGFFATQLTPGINHSVSTITASSGSSSAVLTVVTVRLSSGGNPAPPPNVELIKPLDDRVITAQAGQTLPEAIQVLVVDGNGQAIAGAGLTVSTGLDPSLFPSASCEGGTILTDGTGVASCDLVVGGRIGRDVPIRVNVGRFRDLGNLVLEVTPGPPALVRIEQGNSQNGNPGQTLPLALRAQITDAGGNALPSTAVTWEVISGSATLSNTVNTSDLNGRVSTLVTLGSTAGPTQIRVRAGSAEGTFTVTTNVNVSGITKVSGDSQVAQIGTAFGQPLVVSVTDEQNRPVNGIGVNFAVSGGSATLSASSATTNASGNAQVNVTGGSNAGPITVSASIPNGPSVTFNLTARLPGPVFTETSFFNAASNQRGISPGSLAIITVSGVAPNLNGCSVAPNFGLGSLPTTFRSVQVEFGNTFAPIAYICNVDGRETIAIQVPFEMAPGLVPVRISAGAANTLVNNVQIQSLSPGIFEHMVDARRYAVLQRADGSFVSNTNRAQRGERIRLYATGLGQTLPLTGTNRAGAVGQAVFAPIVVGINNSGVNVVSSETLPGVVGVYVVTFEVSADAPSGDTVLGLAGIGQDNQNYGAPGSIIAIQ